MLSRYAALCAVSVCSAAFAEIKTERIEYKAGTGSFEGVLAYDTVQEGKRPGVLVCHEWWGCNQYAEMRAKKLAELGYVAFALDMYGKGNTTTDPNQAKEWMIAATVDPLVLRERAVAGLETLANHKLAEPTKLAVIGYCMGGNVALELARCGQGHADNLKVVGVFHSSTLASQWPEGNRGIKGTVLVCHGQDDAMVERGQIEMFHQQAKEAGTNYEFISYSNAVHAFTNPEASGFGIPGVAYNANADKRSWAALKELLGEFLVMDPKPLPTIGRKIFDEPKKEETPAPDAKPDDTKKPEKSEKPEKEKPADPPKKDPKPVKAP